MLYSTLKAVDNWLVWFARPFGVNVREPGKRHAILLGIYAAIYLIALLPLPVVPLVALAVGYFGVIAVGRAWVLNEKRRISITKKLEDGDPDEMPDLRWTALLSALQLVILFPFVFREVQRQFGLYTVPEGANFWTWVTFTLDSYNKAFLGLLGVYGIHFEEIGYASTWGQHLVTLSRLTFDYLLIQGLFRLFAIRESIHEAVAAVKTDYDIARRVGRRAVAMLIASLKDRDALVRLGSATALGCIGDGQAVKPLLETFKDKNRSVSSTAVEALVSIRDSSIIELVILALQDTDVQMRMNAALALGQLGDTQAIQPLIEALQDKEEAVRNCAAESLGKLGDRRAVKPLLQLIEEDKASECVVRALGKLKDPLALGLLTPLLQVEDPSCRMIVAEALGDLGDERAIKALLPLHDDPHDLVRRIVADSLEKLGHSQPE